jgi:predicted glycosyltransferase
MTRRKPVLLFYCQHSAGMGHLVRSVALVRALAENFHVVFLNGGRMPAGQTTPQGVEIVQMPPLGMDLEGLLLSLDADYTVETAKSTRRRLILEFFERYAVQVIMIELFPFGRKKFADEIVPLLESACRRTSRKPLILCSLRDILVGARRDQQYHDDRAAKLVNNYFDAVLVHADPAFARLEDSFKPEEPLKTPVHYTGFVTERRRDHAGTVRKQQIIVSAGGGIVGARLFNAAIMAHRVLWIEARLPMTIVAGPFLPEPDWQAVQVSAAGCEGLTLLRSVPNLGAEMDETTMSVSQCGYNTAMDIVSSGVSALVVPYAEKGEDEQTNRARRLEQLGLLRVLESTKLDGSTLADEIRRLTEFCPTPTELDFNGAAHTSALVIDLLKAKGCKEGAQQ